MMLLTCFGCEKVTHGGKTARPDEIKKMKHHFETEIRQRKQEFEKLKSTLQETKEEVAAQIVAAEARAAEAEARAARAEAEAVVVVLDSDEKREAPFGRCARGWVMRMLREAHAAVMAANARLENEARALRAALQGGSKRHAS